MNEELERTRKAAIVAWFKVLLHQFPGGTEENCDSFQESPFPAAISTTTWYLLYYTIPSTEHKSQSYRYMFRFNKSSSGVSKNQN